MEGSGGPPRIEGLSGLVTIGSHREQLGSYRKWELLKRDREGEREMKMEREIFYKELCLLVKTQ